MNFKKLFVLLALGSFILSFNSCSKDEDNNSNPSTENPTPNFSDADGLLAAVQVITFIEIPVIGGTQTILTDAATGGFFDSAANTSTYLDGGAVTCNGNTLKKTSSNQYIFPNQDNSTDIDLDISSGSGNTWSVVGAGTVPAINYTTSKTMPSSIELNGDYSTGTAGSALVVALKNTAQADSIIWTLAVGSKTVTHTTAGNMSSHTFSASETQGMSGKGLLQIAPYRFESTIVGSSKIYFLNEKVLNQFIDF